jgi:hypothetical protein
VSAIILQGNNGTSVQPQSEREKTVAGNGDSPASVCGEMKFLWTCTLQALRKAHIKIKELMK